MERQVTRRRQAGLHIHQELHALVKVLLLKSNANGDNSVGLDSSSLDKFAVGGTLLVDDILAQGDAKGSGAESAQKDSSDLHTRMALADIG